MIAQPRRNFIRVGSLAAAATAAATFARPAFSSALDQINVALIGAGGQGKGHLKSYAGMNDVKVAFVCDVDKSHLAEAKKLAPAAQTVSDLRRVLDSRDVDAVVIATPDHWHTPAALLALAAGKHVYVEKPCSHNIREGRALVQAAERSGLRVQHGTQSRSHDFINAAVKLIRDGAIGDVLIAKAWDVQYRPPIGKAKPTEPPAELDYDMWVGPAPMVPYQSNRAHYNWHWWHHFGTGDAGNDGVHEMDIARWGLGVNVQPSRITAFGGKYVHDDDQQFPDTLTAAFEYPGPSGSSVGSRQLHFEMRLWSRYAPEGMDNGNEFLGTKGRLLLTKRGKLELFGEKGERVPVKLDVEVKPVGLAPHQRNFIEAIRGNTKLNADASTGHLSSSLPHLANLACRLGRSIQLDPANETAIEDEAANKMLGREYREDHWAAPHLS